MADEATRTDRPGRGGYAVAAGLVAAGLVLFLAAVVPAVNAVGVAVEGLQRFVAEGPGEVGSFRAAEAGRTRIQYEPVTRVGGVAFDTEPTWEPTLELVDAAGNPVELLPPNSDPDDPDNSTVVYRVDGRAGHTLAVADLPAPGMYSLSVDSVGLAGDVHAGGVEPAPARGRVLAVGNVPARLLKDGLFGIYGAAALLGLLGCAAAILALITWARRHGTKTERIDGQPTAWDHPRTADA